MAIHHFQLTSGTDTDYLYCPPCPRFYMYVSVMVLYISIDNRICCFRLMLCLLRIFVPGTVSISVPRVSVSEGNVEYRIGVINFHELNTQVQQNAKEYRYSLFLSNKFSCEYFWVKYFSCISN